VELAQDGLSSALNSLRITGRILCTVDVRGPFGVFQPPTHRLYFHVIRRGTVALRVGDEGPWTEVRAGDVVLLRGRQRHHLADEPGRPTRFICDLDDEFGRSDGSIHLGTEGPETRYVSGCFDLGVADDHPIMQMLPDMLHLGRADAVDDRGIFDIAELLATELEASAGGAQSVISRLSEVLFIKVLRAWSSRATSNWMSAVRDEHVGRALASIHTEPRKDWDLAALARHAGMSRSAFAGRFSSMVGVPPMTYLRQWRMHVAASALEDERLLVSQVAYQVGYDSESAFSRAFSRERGMSPAAWRTHVRQRAAVGPPV